MDGNVTLFGGGDNPSTANSGDGSKGKWFFVGYDASSPRILRPIASNGTQFGNPISVVGTADTNTVETLYDLIVIYDHKTNKYFCYLNGKRSGSPGDGAPIDLSALQHFAIGGVAYTPFNDNAAELIIKDFLILNGTINSDQAAALHKEGPDVNIETVSKICNVK